MLSSNINKIDLNTSETYLIGVPSSGLLYSDSVINDTIYDVRWHCNAPNSDQSQVIAFDVKRLPSAVCGLENPKNIACKGHEF